MDQLRYVTEGGEALSKSEKNIMINTSMDASWYAVYTKPRWEKKVSESLSLVGISNYCPLNKVIRQWSDRKKTVYQPLFSSYVFVHVAEKQLSELKGINGVISLVTWLGKPAIIKNEEIDTIKKFLNKHENVRIEKRSVMVNDSVKVTSGFFTDKMGTVVAVKNHTAVIALPSLGYVLYAEVEESNLEKTPVQR